MILTHEDFSNIERSFGPEAAAPVIHAFQKIEHEIKIEVKRDLLMELATKSDIAALKTDIAELRGATKTDIARIDGKIDRLEMLIKVLIGLVVIAISFFSPVASELIKLIK